MKNTIILAALLAVGTAVTSQAVVIHWAASAPSVSGATTAALVYVSTTGGAAPTWNGSGFVGGTLITTTEGSTGGIVDALPDHTVGEQATTDAFASGKVYVVLFNNVGSYAVSSTWLGSDDQIGGTGGAIGAITDDIFNPPTGLFNPIGFSGWTPVPEPSTLALLAIGAAAVACRRRKLS
jgi:hypothetical protein